MSAPNDAPRPCINGCRTRSTGGARRPLPAEDPGRLCRFCDERLRKRLIAIPETYALLPYVVEPGSVDRNPETKQGKRAHPPVPLRVEVIDLLDIRRLLATPDDWRGVIGTLVKWGMRVRTERRIDRPDTTTVSGEAALLLRHRLWITEQDWVGEFYAAIGDLHRELADATGDYRPRPVGTHAEKDDGTRCGGPLMPSDNGGVHCPRCGQKWSHGQLGILGGSLRVEPQSTT